MGRAWCQFAAVAALLAQPLGDAAAGVPPGVAKARLVYDAAHHAAACPSAEDVEDGVSAHLGYAPWAADAPRRVILKIRDGRPGLEASLSFVDAAGKVTGRRVLRSEGGDCRELVATTALSIAVALDPMVVLAPTPTPSTPHAAPPEATPPPPVPPPPATPAPAPRVEAAAHPRRATGTRQWRDAVARWFAPRLLAGARLTGNLGSQPAPTLGPAVDLAAGVGPLVGFVDARLMLPNGGRGRDGAFYLSQAWMTGGVCVDRGVVAACPTLSLGGVVARGDGNWVIRSGFAWTAAVGVRGVARLPVFGPLHLVFTGDANVALRRVALRRASDGAGLWTAPPLFAELGVGLAWSMP